jgi:23S rRNA pseudouridine2605 synthase
LRINKYLSLTGLGSRRKVEQYIVDGKVKVNGKIVTNLATQIDPDKDVVEYDNSLIESEQYKYFMLNKPKGLECTMKKSPDSFTMADFIEQNPALKNCTYVGRLDKESEGLLLLSNDGRIVEKLTNPKYQKPKRYVVTVDIPFSEAHIEDLERGMIIDGYRTRKAEVTKLTNRKFSIVLTEGKNRQIRQMCYKVDLRVHRLIRTEFDKFSIGELKAGEYEELPSQQFEEYI